MLFTSWISIKTNDFFIKSYFTQHQALYYHSGRKKHDDDNYIKALLLDNGKIKDCNLIYIHEQEINVLYKVVGGRDEWDYEEMKNNFMDCYKDSNPLFDLPIIVVRKIN